MNRPVANEFNACQKVIYRLYFTDFTWWQNVIMKAQV
jgi:hypothetical protein